MYVAHKIIGLSGTNGSGKDCVAHMLVERHGFFYVAIADIIRREVRERGLDVTRETQRQISTEWRRQHGVAIMVDMAMQIYEAQDGKFKGLVMGSLRNPGEVDRLHDLGGVLVWVDADPRLRYQRVVGRNRGDDQKSLEEFLADEQAEMFSMGDEATLSGSEVRARADIILENNLTTIEEFYDYTEISLASFRH